MASVCYIVAFSKCALTFGGFVDGTWIDGLGGSKGHKAGDKEGNESVGEMHFDFFGGCPDEWSFFEGLSVFAAQKSECSSVVGLVCNSAN